MVQCVDYKISRGGYSYLSKLVPNSGSIEIYIFLEFDSSDLNARQLPLPVPCPQTDSTEEELISFPPLSAQPVHSLENSRKRLKPQTLDLDVKVNQPYQRIVYLDPEPGEKFKSEPSCVILPTLTKYSISVKKPRNESLGQ